jgi:signal transduction histidine kinase
VTLVALYGVAVAGHRMWTLAVTVLFAGGGLLVRLVVEQEPLVAIVLNSALYILVSLLGDAVHTRRQLAREAAERLRLAHAERDAELRRRLAQERLQMAHELHDVMAHTVTTMSIQAAAAADSLDHRPEAARAALGHLRASAADAMRELRATIGILRAPEGPEGPEGRAPSPTLADLDELVATLAASGLQVDLRRQGRVRPVGGVVELTAYRIVQEALTNVIRHADTDRAQVTLRYDDDALQVCIDDDGRGTAGGAVTSGHGLRGIRERVEALDGRLTVGPRPKGGFRVQARLPTGDLP